jgi:hypothetical protein
MRSKKVLVVVAALIACLAIGSATVATAHILKKKKFPATITLSVQVNPANPPYNQGSGRFSGTVTSGGPKKCHSGRSVTFSGPTPVPGTTTNGSGGYSSTVSSRPAGGSYTATVAKRKIVKKKKHLLIICKAATSAPVAVP